MATAASSAPDAGRMSPWAPLRHRVFAFLFAAQLGSHIGTFLQTVAASWLMLDLNGSPALVALIQTAALLPVLLFGLVAGALADIVDRRRLLIAAQSWMCACAGTLAVLTELDLVTPAVLLAMTFAMGTGGALMGPAWQAIQPDLVPAREFTQAVALSSVTFNTGRTIGPALGGALVATAGAGWAFAINAASFVGVLLVLAMWRPEPVARMSPESLRGAVRAGWRYGAHAPAVRSVLVRTCAFAPAAAAVQALLPTLVRDRLGGGSAAYGVLLGCFGGGAVLAAVVRPWIDERIGRDHLVVVAAALIAAQLVIAATVRTTWAVGAALVVAGGAWTSATVTLNVAAQRALPWWVRARGLGLYMLVLAGGIAIGSAVWGAIAAWDLPAAHVAAGATLLLGTVTVRRWRLDVVDRLDLRPAATTEPMVTIHPDGDAGPVLVTVTYRVPAGHQAEFATRMRAIERHRRVSGAQQWGLFRDLADPDLFLETFVTATWDEHLRQHQRRTMTADVRHQEVRQYVDGDVRVAHLVSAYAPGVLDDVGDVADVGELDDDDHDDHDDQHDQHDHDEHDHHDEHGGGGDRRRR